LYHAQAKAEDIMTIHPKTIESQSLAAHALEMMRNYNITQLIVTENEKYVGIIHLHDLIKEGII
jgi:arabinose-5-phosphate isomerase